MSQPAINLVNPAATCPEWCSSTHKHDDLIPDFQRGGEWSALHQGSPEPVQTNEQTVPKDAAARLEVQLEHFVGNSDPSLPWMIYMTHVDGHGEVSQFNVTARQALRLAELLVRQAEQILVHECIKAFGSPR